MAGMSVKAVTTLMSGQRPKVKPALRRSVNIWRKAPWELQQAMLQAHGVYGWSIRAAAAAQPRRDPVDAVDAEDVLSDSGTSGGEDLGDAVAWAPDSESDDNDNDDGKVQLQIPAVKTIAEAYAW